MTQIIINDLTTIILSILFPLARWATIEMPSNRPPKFAIATGEWQTVKSTPCCRQPNHCVLNRRHTMATPESMLTSSNQSVSIKHVVFDHITISGPPIYSDFGVRTPEAGDIEGIIF